MREASSAFVHASDVHVACNQVAGDLHVTDEATRDLMRGPTVPIISGDRDGEGASANTEIVPGNVDVSVMGRGRVVVHSARLSVVLGARVNAVMGPAIRVPRCAGFIAA